MSNLVKLACGSLLTLAIAGAPAGAQEIELEPFVEGLALPLAPVAPGDGSSRLFIVQQGGLIRLFQAGVLEAQPFLDLTGQVSCCNEQGLLDVVFHPDYENNGFFFVNYTAANGDTVVSRFSVSADPDRADPDSETEVLRFSQPFTNHNGGDLAFGPDGYLYISSGDGGSGGDPQNNGQDLGTLLGKILRLDVDGLPAAIPPDNPFVGDSSARDEIFAYGLRNPWRFAFDRESGDLFIGDVGQNAMEEVDLISADSGGGQNFGWRLMEGTACFDPATGCNDGSLTLPIVEYGHDEGCSVTGGFRYRGASMPTLAGTYVYGDYCSGRISGATPSGGGNWSSRVLLESGRNIVAFGEDDDGELYLVDRSGGSGTIYRILAKALFRGGFESGDTSGWKSRRPTQLSVVQPGLANSAFALAVSLEGAARPSFLRATRPRAEEGLTVDFRLAANRVDLANGEVEILALVGADGARHVRLTLEPAGNRYRLDVHVLEDDGSVTRIGGTRIARRRATRFGLEWTRASAPGAADGTVRLLRKRKVRVRASDLANGGRVVEELVIGLPDGAEIPGLGAFLLDEFVITR